MNFILSERNPHAQERMDNPDSDTVQLKNTYRQFKTVNRLISGWRSIYKYEIRPFLKADTSNTLLDIGFGGGDIPIKLAKWSYNDGFDLHITAIDPDPRAYEFVQELNAPDKVDYRKCRLSDINPRNQQYDFVVSNHLIHHLGKEELQQVLKQSQNLSRKRVIFNDIRRDDFAYLFFNIFPRFFFRNSFIVEDGLTSIKRSYTKKELSNVVPAKWKVRKVFPFRLLLTCHA